MILFFGFEVEVVVEVEGRFIFFWNLGDVEFFVVFIVVFYFNYEEVFFFFVVKVEDWEDILVGFFVVEDE